MMNIKRHLLILNPLTTIETAIYEILHSDNYDQYRIGIENFKLYIDQVYPDLKQSIVEIVKRQLIPKMMFQLENSLQAKQVEVLYQINFIQELLKKYHFENTFIENGLIYILIRLVSLKNKIYDSEIIKLLVLLLHSNQNKYKQNIQIQILVCIGAQKIMQMIEYQPHQTTKIKQIALLCNIQDQNFFNEKKVFILELCQILLKESNQSGQFITAIELISDIVRYDNIKLLLLGINVLQPIIDSIPNWIKQYRSVLDSILKICLEFIMFNKIAKQIIVAQGFLKYLGTLIQSQFYGVKSYSLQIVKCLANNEQIVERLYINQVVEAILQSYIKNPKSYEIIELLTKLLEFGNEMFFRYCKGTAQNFIQAFLTTFLSFHELDLSRSQLNLITVFQNKIFFFDEIQSYFIENQERIEQRMKQLYIRPTYIFDFYQIHNKVQ